MTCDDSDKHHRRSIRLRGYDYAQPGAYFVTVCTRNQECVLGEIVDGRVGFSPFGQVADECWRDLPSHFPEVLLDQFAIMPNHVHGILVLVGAMHASPLPVGTPAHGPRPGSIGAIVGSFKSATTKRVNGIRGTPGAPFWQRNYFEHIIRDEDELNEVRTYIAENPLRWELDENHPRRIGPRDDRTV